MDIRRKVNLYRRYYKWHKAGCIFIHVPKAAGTSINHALYGRTLGHYTFNEINEKFPGLVKKSFVFSVVRNPYDRLVSAYHFAKKGRTADMGISKPAQYKIPEFETFDKFVSQWLVNQDLLRIDHVFRPQYTYIRNNGGHDLDYLGKVETLQSDMAFISERLNKPLRLGSKNVIKRNTNYKSYYCQELVDKVYSIYREDFELLGYPKMES